MSILKPPHILQIILDYQTKQKCKVLDYCNIYYIVRKVIKNIIYYKKGLNDKQFTWQNNSKSMLLSVFCWPHW